MRQMETPSSAPASLVPESAKSVFSRVHMKISKQQGVGWLFLIMAGVIQIAFLVFIIVDCINTKNKLQTCTDQADIAICPKPSAITPIWVSLTAASIVLLTFLLAAGWSFTFARV